MRDWKTRMNTPEIVMMAWIDWREDSRKPPEKFRPSAADHHHLLVQSDVGAVRKEER